MVHHNSFQDFNDKILNSTCVTLPAYKETCLKVNYENNETEFTYESLPPMPFANSAIYEADLSHWRRLTAFNDNCKAIYEVTFDVADSNFSFKAGDTIGVMPKNLEDEVNTILNQLGLNAVADTTYTISVDKSQKGGKIPPHIPVKSTLRHLLTFCVDIRSPMKKLFLLALSRYTTDENERKLLEYLCSKEGCETYQTHILQRKTCILDIFREFKTCKPKVEILMANLPRLLPRPYSIVNTGVNSAKKINICFSVKHTDMSRKGLTTGWLESIIVNHEDDLKNSFSALSLRKESERQRSYEKIPIYMRKNLTGFSLPSHLKTSLLLIGAGTGIAPFLGFLEEIELAKENNPKGNFGDVYLFFGCKNSKLDFIYERELKEFLAKGVLSKIFTAFSRDDSSVKYVQDALMQNGKNVAELIENDVAIFICGDLKAMAVQVKETLIKCLVQYQKKTEEEANKLIYNMENNKRYHVDTWS